MGGVIARDGIYDAFMRGPEHVIELFHGYTYSAHPLACAAGLATLDLYRDEDLFARAKALEPRFADAAMTLKGLPGVLDIRTVGLDRRHRSRLAARRAGPARLRGDGARASTTKACMIRIAGDTHRAVAAADRERGADRRDFRQGRTRDQRRLG